MQATLNILFFLLAPIWAVGALFIYFRYYAPHATMYLRRFPPIDRYQTLDMYTPGSGNPPGTGRSYHEAFWLAQDDLELDRLRRDGWRRAGYLARWIFGFPILAIAMVALLIATGYIH